MRKGFTPIEFFVLMSIVTVMVVLLFTAVKQTRENVIRVEERREAEQKIHQLEKEFQQNSIKWVVFEIDGKKMAAPKNMIIELEALQGILD